jgi:hypothetical protein
VMFLTEYARPVQLLGVDDRIKQMLGREPCDISNCVVLFNSCLGFKIQNSYSVYHFDENFQLKLRYLGR